MKNKQFVTRSAPIFGAVFYLASVAQAQVTPESINRSTIRPGARALGMGGSYLSAADDASAAIYNPAAIAQGKRFTLPIGVATRTKNLDFTNIYGLVTNLQDLGEEVKGNSIFGVLGTVSKAFNEVYDFARDGGATPGGAPVRLRATVTPTVGLSLGDYGLVTSASGFVDARLGIDGERRGTRVIDANAGALTLTTVAIPFAEQLKTNAGRDAGTFGISAKYVRAGYAATQFLATQGVNPQTNTLGGISGNFYNPARDEAFDIDLGYTSPEIAKLGGARVIFAARNVLSPQFKLSSNTNRNGRDVGQTRFDFRQRPQFDIGVAASKAMRNTLFAAELHNLSATNGGDLTLHLGAEYQLNRVLALRAGLDDDKFVSGVGVKIGPTRLDIAVGTDYIERFALGLSTAF